MQGSAAWEMLPGLATERRFTAANRDLHRLEAEPIHCSFPGRACSGGCLYRLGPWEALAEGSLSLAVSRL